MHEPQIITEGYNFTEMARDLDKGKSAVFMGKDAAFFGPLMCTLDFVWSKGLKTAATDGERFYWDPDDFLRCDIHERKSTIMHELWHIARLHALRQGSRCPDIWNCACDILINRELIKMGYQNIQAPYWLVRPDLDHIELEEEIYDYLANPSGGGMQPGQQPSGGRCQHGNMPLSPGQKQSMVNSTVKAIQQAKFSNQAGSIPGGIEQIIEQFLAPKIPWEVVMYNWFTDLIEEDFTWARPNRRYTEMYLPSRYEDEGRLKHVVFFEDVSGSITDKQMLRFNSEAKYIWNTFKPNKMTLAQFDTRITQVDEFHEGDPFEKIVIVGRGGTDLEPVREWIKEHKPDAVVIFSDLYCGPMENDPSLPPIIWIVMNNKEATVPFGKMVHINE